MQKSISLIIIFMIIALFPAVCKAENSVITDFGTLVDNAPKYDKKVITARGEAVGEPMKRGNYTWINIGDGSNAIGIWMKNEDAFKVKTFGNDKYRGDILEVTGIFSRACSEHGGDLDIHAYSIEIQKKGYNNSEPLDKNVVTVSAILSFITLCVVMIYFYKRKQTY